MPYHTELKHCQAEVSNHLSHLSPAMAAVLGLYVFGVMLVRHSGQTLVSETLSRLFGVKYDAMRQRLRELTYEVPAKRGRKRQALDVSSCFAPLLQWVLSWFAQTERRLVLVLDVTYLRDQFDVFSVSVVIARCAIPVAWHIQVSGQRGSWHPLWEALLGHLQGSVPASWSVHVLADGGLYSKRLFTFIATQLGWHPHLRIDRQGWFRHQTGPWQPLLSLARRGMAAEAYEVLCFKGNPLPCTLLVEWEADFDKPCLVVTDLPLLRAGVNTYHLRCWIEAGFKSFKRGGLHWEHTKMTAPARAERLWLVLSIALLLLLRRGLAEAAPAQPDTSLIPRARLSAATRGWVALLSQLLTASPLPAPIPFTYPTSSFPSSPHTYP
jgi:hypothetical protein